MDFLSDSGGLSWEIIVENRKKARSELLKNRTENSPNTVKAYGDVQNYTSGIPKEWKQYADAKAGDIVNGVTMTEEKKKFTVFVTPEKVEDFFQNYFTQRPQFTTSGKVLSRARHAPYSNRYVYGLTLEHTFRSFLLLFVLLSQAFAGQEMLPRYGAKGEKGCQ